MPMIASALSACMNILSMSVRLFVPLRSELPARPGAQVEPLTVPTAQARASGERNHRAVVGAKLGPREIKLRTGLARNGVEPLAQAQVRAHTARNDQTPVTRRGQRAARLLRERLHDGLLKAVRDI